MKERLKALSFSLFDMGETILGALIFSTFFPLYITKHIDTKVYSFVYGFSFLISFFFALYLGKVADRTALRKEFFTVFMLLTAICGILLFFSVDFPVLSLLIFSLMAIFHQQSFVFYNSLLLDFQSKGFTSGLGVSFGYIGSAFALIFLAEKLSIPSIYVVVSLIFLTLSIPSVIFIKNPTIKNSVSIKEIFKDKRFLMVIVSILFLTEVANALISLMGIYLKKVYNLEDVFIYKVIGFSAIGGIVGGVMWGVLVDRFSAKRIFPLAFILWSMVFISIPFISSQLIVYFGFFVGLSLAHLWTVSRVYIIQEFPSSEISTRMSFLSLSERIASTTGLFVWGLLLLITKDNYVLSAFLMTIFPLLGFFVYKVSQKIT